jgi:Tfp pilus assembly protein PilO
MNDIIVYQSQMQKDNELFWSEHPELFIGVLIVMFVIFVIGWVYNKRK